MSKKLVSRPAQDLRDVMVTFLERKIMERYPDLSLSDAQRKVGQRAGGLSLSTMQRIMSRDTGPSIDTLANLAHTLGCTVAEMLATPAQDMEKSSDTLPEDAKKAPVQQLRRRSGSHR